MSITQANPIITEVLKLHPIKDEVVLFQSEAKFFCESLWGENEITGYCFATNFRFGVAGKKQQLLYAMDPYWSIRAIMTEEDDMTLLYRSGGEEWLDLSQDTICRVIFPNVDLADHAIEHIIRSRYGMTPEPVENQLPEIYRFIHQGNYYKALEQLRKLKDIDQLSGMIDLLVVRSLFVSGKQAEAVSYLSKWAGMALLAYPGVFFADYLWLPWHSGALRLLPSLNDLTEDRFTLHRYVIQAIHAKAEGHNEPFMKYICLAFKQQMSDTEGFNPSWFGFAAKCLNNLYPSTRPYIHEVLTLLRDRYELVVKETDDALTADMVSSFLLDPFEESFDCIAWMESLLAVENEAVSKYALSLVREDFAELLACTSMKPAMELPESWYLDDNVIQNSLEYDFDERLLQIRDLTYRTIGAARVSGIRSPEAKQGLFQLSQLGYREKLKMLDEDQLAFLVTLLKVEEHMAYDRREQALTVLHQWKRVYGQLAGLITDPYLRLAETIVHAYEAWALGDAKSLSELLDLLPKQAPYRWIHHLLGDAIQAIEQSHSPFDSEAAVLEGMLRAANLTQSFARSAWLDSSVKDKATRFYELLQAQMDEAESLKLSESAAALEQLSDKPARTSLFSKMKAWFGNADMAKQANAEQEPIKPVKTIKVAIAGESSSGKTTLLNMIFQTNIFFVTQEEATGVPTEIKYGKHMRMEVWDKSGQLRNTMETVSAWFREDGTTLLEEHLHTLRAFLMEHTSVGSPALEWVGRVVVYAPLAKLPAHVILVDTPGYNADAQRTAITEAEMRSCHMCMYIMDARNALKGKEIHALERIREEAGKTFIILNKMDLVLGDDELDCDGGDAADETVARVRRDLASYFKLPDVVVYPISSMPKQQLETEAHRYADHLNEVVDAIFLEAEHQKLDLIIDASAKTAIEVHNDINRTFLQFVEKQEREIRNMEAVVPKDFTLYEDQAQIMIQNKIGHSRSEFINNMIKELDDAFGSAADSMESWLHGVTSAGRLKNEVQGQATALLQYALNRVEDSRRRELERMGRNVSEEAAAYLQELYRNLPFPAAFDSKSFLNGISSVQLTSSQALQTELSLINYGNGLNGGSVAGAIVGTFLLGPIGTIIGGFLGQLFGGKTLGEVKKEVYDTYINTIQSTWDQAAAICEQDLSEERTASFMNQLNQAVQKQLEHCKRVVSQEIEAKEAALNKEVSELIDLRLSAQQLHNVMDRLLQWRMVRRARLG